MIGCSPRSLCGLLIVLSLLPSIAWGQATGSTVGTVPAGTSTTNASELLKQELDTTLIQLWAAGIHGFFQDLRTSLGLPPAADPATDLLSIVETFAINALNAASTRQLSGL